MAHRISVEGLPEPRWRTFTRRSEKEDADTSGPPPNRPAARVLEDWADREADRTARLYKKAAKYAGKDREEWLRKATESWSTPTYLGRYGNNDDGFARYKGDASVLARHGYVPRDSSVAQLRQGSFTQDIPVLFAKQRRRA